MIWDWTHGRQRGEWLHQTVTETSSMHLSRLSHECRNYYHGVLLLLLIWQGAINPVSATAQLHDDGSVIHILHPTDGAVIAGNDLDLDFQFFKGELADHVHLYLDGQYIKELPRAIMGLSRGPHEIRLIASTGKHQLLRASATVHFLIK